MTPTYRTNRNCFAEAYLAEQLPTTSLWNAADERVVREAYEEFRFLYGDQSVAGEEFDAEGLRANLVDPALEILGLRAVRKSRSGEYFLYNFDRDTEENPLAVADFFAENQPLDGPRGNVPNPNYRLHDAIDASALEHGVLTDGRRWRRYYAPASRRFDSYYEIDLPELLETGDLEDFKYFYLFFRRESFGAGAITEGDELSLIHI